MTRRRERRRGRGTSYTGILRSDRPRPAEAEPQIEDRYPRFRWRIVSFLIVLCLSGVLVLFFASDVFYVRSIAVGGLQYMTKEEVFTYSRIASWHIFWVDPQEVRENLLEFPSVADAQVRISWPPNMVDIIIEEREPALVWEQSGTAVWVDINGKVMAQRAERPDLTRIVADTLFENSPLETGNLDLEVVYGALQLRELRPEVTTWRYDPARGLGFRNPNGWDVWFGVGSNMQEKQAIYGAMAASVQQRGIAVAEINIVNPDAPYYTVLFER